jgi:hypothetical protein
MPSTGPQDSAVLGRVRRRLPWTTDAPIQTVEVETRRVSPFGELKDKLIKLYPCTKRAALKSDHFATSQEHQNPSIFVS